MAAGCSCFLKIFVLVVNILYALIGLAMLGIGIWMLAYPLKFDEVVTHHMPEDIMYMTGADLNTIKIIGIIGIVSGGVLLIAGILGIVGALMELRSVLGLNFFFLLLLFCGILFLVFFVFLFGEELNLLTGYSFFRHKQYSESIRSTMQYEADTSKMDGLLYVASEQYGCCGLDDIKGGICNMTYAPAKECAKGMDTCDLGCYKLVTNSVRHMSFGVGIAVLVTGCSLLIGMILSMAYHNNLRKNIYIDSD